MKEPREYLEKAAQLLETCKDARDNDFLEGKHTINFKAWEILVAEAQALIALAKEIRESVYI